MYWFVEHSREETNFGRCRFAGKGFRLLSVPNTQLPPFFLLTPRDETLSYPLSGVAVVLTARNSRGMATRIN